MSSRDLPLTIRLRRSLERATNNPIIMFGVMVGLITAIVVTIASEMTGASPTTRLIALLFSLIFLLLLVFSMGRARVQRERDLFADTLNAVPLARQIVAGSRTIHANDAYIETFGSAHLHIRRELEKRLTGAPEQLEHITRMAQAASSGQAVRREFSVFSLENPNQILWWEVSAYPLPHLPGYVLWGIDDITHRREMERLMHLEQERITDLMENAPFGFYSVDRDGRFLFVNKTLAAWVGLDPQTLANGAHRLHDFVGTPLPATAAAFDPFGDAVTLGGEVVLRNADGRTFDAYIRQEVVYEGKADEVHTRSVVHNLSRSRELEAALRDSERRFQRLFEDAPVGIALLDRAGEIEECNEAFKALMPDRNQDMKGQNIQAFLHADDRATVLAQIGDAIDQGDKEQPGFEVRLIGTPSPTVTIYLSRRLGVTWQEAGVVAHFIDTTQQRQLEQQFAQSQKMQAIGQLAGGIAHDFNNLLTAMIGFCDLLLTRHRPGDQSFADIMQIKQNANRAANLVRQLLAFSRQQTLQPRVHSITDILSELSHMLRRLIGENIELELLHGRNLWTVKVDQGQLEQVIINLAVNARDAMQGGGRLSIRTENMTVPEATGVGSETMPGGDYVLIEVADTGSGIPPEIIGRIFDPFFSTKEVGQGTGLGLAMVYGIIKQTNGFILVESELGKGTIFRIYLPAYIAKAVDRSKLEGAEKAAPHDLTGFGTILLVEDEDAVRLFGARALRNKGYNVLEARSGEAALETINAQADGIDLVITDVVMPRMDGPELVKKVRERHPAMKVIFISGYAEDSVRKRIDESQDIHFLPKPFSLKQLAAKVKEVIGDNVG